MIGGNLEGSTTRVLASTQGEEGMWDGVVALISTVGSGMDGEIVVMRFGWALANLSRVSCGFG